MSVPLTQVGPAVRQVMSAGFTGSLRRHMQRVLIPFGLSRPTTTASPHTLIAQSRSLARSLSPQLPCQVAWSAPPTPKASAPLAAFRATLGRSHQVRSRQVCRFPVPPFPVRQPRRAPTISPSRPQTVPRRRIRPRHKPSRSTSTRPSASRPVHYPAALSRTLTRKRWLASGGTPGYTWAVTTGALPTGLSLNSSGNLFGTPTAAGTSNFTVQVTDSTSPTHQTASKALSLTIGPALSITTSSLPSGLATTAYSQALAATGGTPGYTWSLASGSLPTGLTISAAGTISGTPTAAGTFNFTAKATDSTSPTAQTATQPLTITIGAAVSITTASFPGALVTTPYSQSLAATGGTPGYTWSLASGSLPTGLSLSAAGTISGTPTAAGTFNFTVKATDSTSPTAQIATQALSIVVGAAVTVTTTSLPNGLATTPYSQTLAATGGTPAYSWSIASGSLPNGLSLVGATITGTPTAAGTYNFTVQVTDSTAPTHQTATQALIH